ncbi:MAG: heme exporter protein CcmB, partial [Candidatus Nitrosotenuis sp.]
IVFFFHFSAKEVGVLILSLMVGTPLLGLFGALGVALTVGLRHNNVLLSFLLLPLYVPVLIFGAGAVTNAANDLPFIGQLALLAAMLILGVITLPFAIAAALKMCNES